MADVEELQARVAELEQENALLRTGRPGFSWRSVVAGLLIVVGLILAPVAVLGTWARVQLVDTDRFVSTFAPLAQDPDVQAFVSDQVSDAVIAQLDSETLVREVFDGIRQLDLPPRASAALTLLEAPAAQGIDSLVARTVDEIIASEQFATIWAGTLRVTHERAVAVLQGQPDTLVVLTDDGVIAIDLGVVVGTAQDALTERGLTFAEALPVVERTVPIVQDNALVLVRTLYQVAVAAGYWLPWVVLALLTAGVLLSLNRLRAVALTGVGLVAVFLLTAAGLGIGRTFFVTAVSPAVMPAASAHAIFEQLTALMMSTVLALTLAAAIIAVIAWLAGGSRWARGVRAASDQGFGAVRASADRHGFSTGRFGQAVDRWHPAIVVVAAIASVLLLLALRPVTLGTVIGAVALFLGVVLVAQLLRRPAPPERSDAAAAEPSDDVVPSEIGQ